jgi:hypothetical protein
MEEQQQDIFSSRKNTHDTTQRKILFIVIGVGTIVIAGLAVTFFGSVEKDTIEQQQMIATEPVDSVSDAEDAFGADMLDRVKKPIREATNEIPNTNPLENTQTNPYANYSNPFSR